MSDCLKVVIIVILILGCLVFVIAMLSYTNGAEYCSKEYGGKMAFGGYCTYVENGTSQSFSIWDIDKGEKENG